MTEFTWIPEFGSSADVTPNVTTNRFGDGYEQRIANGMNTLPSSWSLTFANRESDEALAILAFLNARAGVEAFLWTPPDSDDPLVFKCAKWNRIPMKGTPYRFSISATFDQVFEP